MLKVSLLKSLKNILNKIEYYFRLFNVQIQENKNELTLFVIIQYNNYIFDMWFKYFDKRSWQMRVWRKVNLKFNQDDSGMFKVKYITRWKDLYFRLARTEAALRGINLFLLFTFAATFSWFKEVYILPNYIIPAKLAEEKQLKANDDKARAQLFYNRIGAPTRPHRSIADIVTFLSGSETFNDLADSASFEAAANINTDQQKGLDSWMTTQDYKMLKYYQEANKKGGHH